MESVDLNSLMMQIPGLTSSNWQNDAFKEGRSIEIKLELAETPRVHCSPSDFRQVFTNLVFNAW